MSPDHAEAAKWYSKATKQGDAKAQSKLDEIKDKYGLS
jgi:TPR repeat protein